MAITLDASQAAAFPEDRLSGAARTNVIDRWIYVFTAASFIAIVLAGFVPDSFEKVAAIQAGHRPPFPLILHFHAVLMGSFLLLLLGQTLLVAMGKCAWHMQLGLAAVVLFPAIVIVGVILVPTIYHQALNAAQTAPLPARQHLQGVLLILDDIFLLQLRAGILFSILMWFALRARTRNSGLHKRLILLATAPLLAAAIDRIEWLPTTMPHSTLGLDFYTLLAVAPMFIWDLTRNRHVHRAYVIFASVFLPVSAVVFTLWNTPIWHATAHHIMGV
jgi:hypothetical protein